MSSTATTPNTRVEPLTYEVKDFRPSLGGVDLLTLVETEGSPLYVLDGAGIRAMAHAYQDTLKQHYPGASLPLYASKANLCKGICQLMEQANMGLDVVSGGELYTAIQASFPLERVFFNGNNKSAKELIMALNHGVGRITVDNLTELDLLASVAKTQGKIADILLRITPGIDCHTHDYIRTGRVDSKFGLNLTDIEPAVAKITGEYADCIRLKGLHAHIGSQIFESEPYHDLARVMMGLYETLRARFDGLTLPDLNLGGGLGIAYTHQDDPLDVNEVLTGVCRTLDNLCKDADYPLPRLMLEPGRSMIATAGITLYTLGSIKHVPGVRTYMAVDGGMGDNIRPSLYQANYSAVVANRLSENCSKTVTIAGKYCESGDVLIQSLCVPEQTQKDDILLVFDTGAYNYAMASTYNRVPRPAMILVEAGEIKPLVRRETYDDILRLDCSL